FLEGVQATDPEVKVDTRYVNSYVDTATAKEMGLSMINDKNCDIIWGVAGLSGNGAAEAALESGKAWFIGVDSDQELTLSSELAAITLTSGLKNVGNSLVWIFDEWDAGRTYWGQQVNLGLAEGGVGVVTDKNFATVAPQAVQDKVLAAEAAIKDGTIVVPSAIGDSTDAVKALRDSMLP
ncbi:MAG TPA: BMP family ABC transporter substrate-binding protein, partial [Clostridia bacterium]|nr:BMP family ABC transporter substrate-binding protein [Clostridia bacterium]